MAGPRPEQLALSLLYNAAMERDDFVEGACNAAALHAIDRSDDWSVPTLAIIGPPGSGKSHLARIWARDNEAIPRQADSISEDIVETVLARQPVAIEDAPAADRTHDEALFQILNASAHGRTRVLITATRPPSQWPAKTNDLKSRLAAIPVVRIDPPDEPLLTAVMMKQLADRQIMVDPRAVSYAGPRLERTFAAVRAFVEAAERLSISQQRHLTVPVARQVLVNLSQTG